MKQIIALLLSIALMCSVCVVSVNASTESDYIIYEDVSVDGEIKDLGDALYKYDGIIDFSFRAYSLKDYALSKDMLILVSDDINVLHASIHLVDDKLVFVYKQGQEITEYVIDNCSYIDNLLEYEELTIEENYDMYVELARTLTWFTAYTEENRDPIIEMEADFYQTEVASIENNISFSGSENAKSAATMTVGFYFDESCLMNVGCYSGKVLDTNGDIAGAYVIETYMYSSTYVSLVAVWDIDYTLILNADGVTMQAIGNITKKFNLFFQYNPRTNVANVVMPDDNTTYVITRNFDTLFRIYGSSNEAYISEYAFYMNAGGSASSSGNMVLTAAKMLAKRYKYGELITSIYITARNALEALEHYTFSQSKQAYEITNNSSVNYAKTIASIFDGELYRRYSACEIRALIRNLPTAGLGRMYFQVEFDVECIATQGTSHHTRIVHPKSLKIGG